MEVQKGNDENVERDRKVAVSSFSIDSILTSKKSCNSDKKCRNSKSDLYHDSESSKSHALDLTNRNSEIHSSMTTANNCPTANKFYSAMIPTLNVPFSEYYLERLYRLRGAPGPLRFPGTGYMPMSEETKRYVQAHYDNIQHIPNCFQTFYVPGRDHGKISGTVSDRRDNYVDDVDTGADDKTDDNHDSDVDVGENDVDDLSVQSTEHGVDCDRNNVPEHRHHVCTDDEEEVNNPDDDDDDEDDDETTEDKTGEYRAISDRLHGRGEAWFDQSGSRETMSTGSQLNKKNRSKLGKETAENPNYVIKHAL